jgi:hypothetical protein
MLAPDLRHLRRWQAGNPLIGLSEFPEPPLFTPPYSVRPEGANHQWRKISPGELSIASVADERLGRVTDLVEAS